MMEFQDITLLEEISEQDLCQMAGGTNPFIAPGLGLAVNTAVSWVKGNTGIFCTTTLECSCY